MTLSDCRFHNSTVIIIMLHLFSLANVGLTQVLGKNVGTSYIESQWDLTHFTVQSETPCVCGFLPNRKAVIGTYPYTNVPSVHMLYSGTSIAKDTPRKKQPLYKGHFQYPQECI